MCPASARGAGPARGYAGVRAVVASVHLFTSSQTARTRGERRAARRRERHTRTRDSCEWQQDLVSANRAGTILVRAVHSHCDFQTSRLLS